MAARDPSAREALEAWHAMRKIFFETEAKAEALREILERHRDSKILIFTEYTALAKSVSERFLIPL